MKKRYIFLWGVIGLSVATVVFVSVLPPAPEDNKPAVAAAKPDTKAFAKCLWREAKAGGYQYDDGGASAGKLTEACVEYMDGWLASCEHDSGDTERACTAKAIFTAQLTLKMQQDKSFTASMDRPPADGDSSAAQ